MTGDEIGEIFGAGFAAFCFVAMAVACFIDSHKRKD